MTNRRDGNAAKCAVKESEDWFCADCEAVTNEPLSLADEKRGNLFGLNFGVFERGGKGQRDRDLESSSLLCRYRVAGLLLKIAVHKSRIVPLVLPIGKPRQGSSGKLLFPAEKTNCLQKNSPYRCSWHKFRWVR